MAYVSQQPVIKKMKRVPAKVFRALAEVSTIKESETLPQLDLYVLTIFIAAWNYWQVQHCDLLSIVVVAVDESDGFAVPPAAATDAAQFH